ncbi:LOG family protein [Paenibacillus rhizoplanae]
MNDFAEGLIALPGGSGTLEEIFLKICARDQLRLH